MPHNLFLTGRPGVGKTTLIHRVLEQLPSLRLAGFTTAEIRGPRGRVGFRATAPLALACFARADTVPGDRFAGGGLDPDGALGGPDIVLAHVGQRSPYRVGAYGVDVAAFEREIVPLLDVQRGDVDLFVVDEVGKMECFSAAFCAAVARLLDDPRPVLGTIALRGPAFVQAVRERVDVELVEVTPVNREGLVGEILARLRKWG